MPIGKPIANCSALVLDGQMQPVAAGATGELFLGGAGLARGYFDLPQMTAERFIAIHFPPATEKRALRTGRFGAPAAVAVWNSSAVRTIRSRSAAFASKLAKFENTVRQCPTVSAAVVIAHEDAVKEAGGLCRTESNTARLERQARTVYLREHVLARIHDPAAFVELRALR